jgi:predicted regulator of Ras-like GTPase activity (Roadblock/LC7/MglB family)
MAAAAAAGPAGGRSPDDQVQSDLGLIRAKVAGVQGSLVATSDGFLVAHDVPGLEPTAIAALAAATRSLAGRTTASTGRGQFREAIARGSDGYIAVYAAGESALVAVVGTADLNIGMLRYQTREIVERIAAYAVRLGAWPAPSGPAPARPDRPAPLPQRRRPAGPGRGPRIS